MKTSLHIFVLILVLGLVGCGDCRPNLSDWKSNHQKMRTVVTLYQGSDLMFGNNNPRIERIIPDSLRIKDFDTIIYVNIGSRGDLNNENFTCRFYKLNQNGEKIKEVVYTTQVHELNELNRLKCCVKVEPNWYVRSFN